MIHAFTVIGFVCCCFVVIAVTLLALVWVVHLFTVRTTAIMRAFRFIWGFYKSLDRGAWAKSARYHVVVYDKRQRKFIHVESLNDSLQNEGEYAEQVADIKRRLARKEEANA